LSGSGTRGDQVENARFFEQAGAALTLTGNEVDPARLSDAVNALAEDHQRREAMSRAARQIGALDGAAIISDAINAFTARNNK